MARKQTVLIWEQLERFNTVDLNTDFTVINVDTFFSNTKQHLNDVEGIILSPMDISKFLNCVDISSFSNLKAVSVCGAGINGLDVVELRKRKVRVSSIPQVTAEPTADLAFMMMLAAARNLTKALEISKKGSATRDAAYSKLIGQNVTGATLGILGMGNIGYCIAKRAMGFRMKVLYHNRTRRSQLDEECVNAKYCNTLEELLKQADFLVIAVPLTVETRKLIRQPQLALMKPTSILINVGRGSVVDTDYLVEALQNGTISAAGLDVTEPEPLPQDHPLRHMQNVIITPHSATATVECINEMNQQAVQNLKAGLSGGVMNIEI
ncbi:glyoxylate/hydroxypyruvate reductase B-like isoform X1 [Antedon mediterranea]|uniref:glyoxylate/hydroxypyruvate reductase B-like isoform X1 n=2 Tax=Antedon mediterranea TaxID=105859 RepID=UPI003AF49693